MMHGGAYAGRIAPPALSTSAPAPAPRAQTRQKRSFKVTSKDGEVPAWAQKNAEEAEAAAKDNVEAPGNAPAPASPSHLKPAPADAVPSEPATSASPATQAAPAGAGYVQADAAPGRPRTISITRQFKMKDKSGHTPVWGGI